MIKKTFISLLALPLITACGFTPLHSAPNTASNVSFEDVSIKITDGADLGDKEAGFFVMQRLRDRIGENTGKHILTLDPRLSRVGFGVNSIDVASRFDSIISVNYTLKDAKSGKTLMNGSVRAVSTFGAPRDPYGLIAAEKSAVQQITKEAADRLLIKLAGFYANSDNLTGK